MDKLLLVCVILIIYTIDRASSASCTVCKRGLPRVDCVDEYIPSYPIDNSVCSKIRQSKIEEKRLFDTHGGSYQILCEMDDLSEFTCSSTRVTSSKHSGGGGGFNSSPGYQAH
ncbi:hypothetical protein SNE40_019450 [Patella caerulea]|uniref:Uncharacterized protein n=1 Tax=Patella caerulea TaxID=87958 RepID=A0AAN8JAK7_PATCE